MSEDQKPLRKIFNEAVEIADAPKRAAYLASACGADTDLRHRIEELIAADAESGRFLGGVGDTIAKDRRGIVGAIDPHPASGHPRPSEGRGAGGEGKSFGDYELLEEIARGGMGIVYKARQVSLDRIVAVKLLLLGQYASEEFIHRFRIEASAAASLQHPNIVAIHEVGVHQGQHYFAMDFVDGPDLAQLVRDQPLTAKRAAGYVKTIAEAIHFAHTRRILHRDLKPSNVLIDLNDQPRVTDFGLAKNLGNDSDLTLTGQVMGSPGFMPPEQAAGERGKMGPASDVYSLGAILYHALTGRAPFVGQTVADTLHQVQNHEPIAPRLLAPAVPVDLETICLKCLEKEPGKRFASAQALAEELGRFFRDESIHSRPVSRAEHAWRWCRRKPAIAILGTSVLVLVVAAAVGATIAAFRIDQARLAEKLQREQAQASAVLLELQHAEDLFAAENFSTAIAYLARVLRRDPKNRVAAERLYSALTHRSFGVPLVLPVKSQYPFRPQFSPDGRRLAATSVDGVVEIVDAQSGRPLVKLPRSENVILSVDFSGDGRRIVTASVDGTARIADADTGRAMGAILQHSGPVAVARFSPDGTQVVTASQDKTARLWEASTGQPTSPPLAHQAAVNDASFSPDGSLVVTASKDGYTRIWSARTGGILATTMLHDGEVKGVQFSLDGKYVLTFSLDRTVALWEVHTGRKLAQTPISVQTITSASFSPDGASVLVSSAGGTVKLLNAQTLQPLPQTFPHIGTIRDALFSPDGEKVLTLSENATAVLWDSRTGQPLAHPLPLAHWGHIAQFSPDGSRFCTVSIEGEVRLWNAQPGAALPLKISHGWSSVNFSPDGAQLVTESADHTAKVWATRTGQPLLIPLRHANSIHSAEFSPSGTKILTASADRTARIWDAQSGHALTPPLQHADDVTAAHWSPDGSRVVTATQNGSARIWNPETGQPVGPPLSSPANAHLTEFTPDSQQIVTIYPDGFIRFWDAASGKLHHAIKNKSTVSSVRFSPNGRRMVLAIKLNSALVLDTLTGLQATKPLQHGGWVRYAEFSRDGQHIVTASHDRTARIWKAETGQPLGDPLRHDAEVVRAHFSPDGERVVTACEDGSIRVWDTRSGLPVTEPLRQEKGLLDAIFSPDGRHVASVGSDDGSLRVWDLPSVPLPVPSSWLEIADALAGQRFNQDGRIEPVPDDRLAKLQENFQTRDVMSASFPVRPDDFYASWSGWFFADRALRTVSPFSSVTVPSYIQQLLTVTSLAQHREAVRLAPTNAQALARLARTLMQTGIRRASEEFVQAELHLRRAEAIAPDSIEVLWARADFLNRTGRQIESIALMQKAAALQPASWEFWDTYGIILEFTAGHLDEALMPYSKAVELIEAQGGDGQRWRNIVLRHRSRLLRKMNRFAEARVDWDRVNEIAARDPRAEPRHVDLSRYFNGSLAEGFGRKNDLINLPAGLQTLLGIEFDVRGIVRLRAMDSPPRVELMMVTNQCRRVHFLHAMHRGTEEGIRIGSYRFHMASGRVVEWPIVFGQTIHNFRWTPWRPRSLGTNCEVAWTEFIPAVQHVDSAGWLYKSTWENPHPEDGVESIDFVSDLQVAAPFLFAITTEP